MIYALLLLIIVQLALNVYWLRRIFYFGVYQHGVWEVRDKKRNPECLGPPRCVPMEWKDRGASHSFDCPMRNN